MSLCSPLGPTAGSLCGVVSVGFSFLASLPSHWGCQSAQTYVLNILTLKVFQVFPCSWHSYYLLAALCTLRFHLKYPRNRSPLLSHPKFPDFILECPHSTSCVDYSCGFALTYFYIKGYVNVCSPLDWKPDEGRIPPSFPSQSIEYSARISAMNWFSETTLENVCHFYQKTVWHVCIACSWGVA